MQIIDSFIPKQYQIELFNTISGTRFDWNYQDHTIANHPDPRYFHKEPYRDTPYFHHLFFRDDRDKVSPYFGLVKPLLMFFEHRTGYKIKHTVRVVANLLLPTTNTIIGIPHLDADSATSDLKTILYYINDIDGHTTLFNEEYKGNPPESLTILDTVNPKMGRAVIFDSERYHSSGTPTKGRRMVINAIVEVE